MEKNMNNFKFELIPLDKLIINDTNIYLGKNKEQFIKLLGEPEAVHKNWDGDGFSCYYFDSELMFDCDNDSNIRFIGFQGGHDGELKPYIYGISAFDVNMDELYKILKDHNYGRIEEENEESYGFVEISVGIWKDGANDESDYWTTIGIGEKNCYLEFYNDMIEEKFENFEFNSNNQNIISNVNGLELAMDYYEFMKKHNGNGGEGDFGLNSYIQILNMDELEEYNEMYEIQKSFPNCVAIGTDLGGNHFMYDTNSKKYFSIDCCSMVYEDIMYEENSFEEFLLRWDKELSEE